MFDRNVDEKGLNGLNNSLKYFTDLMIGEWYYYDMVEATNTHEYVIEEDYIRNENSTFELWQVIK